MPGTSIKFGEFELDSSRFELRRDGHALKLERIPMELLLLLVERQGAVVTRQEIIERLWGKDRFVDTEHGINVAVRKIRTALHDDAERPLYIQTVLGKGYRFVGEPLQSPEPVAPEIPALPVPAAAAPAPAVEVAEAPKFAPKGRGSWRVVAAVVIVVLVLAAALFSLNVGNVRGHLMARASAREIHSIAVIPLANLSGDASQDYFTDGMTDEIITMLAKNTSLRVISRTSAMQFKGARKPLPEIGKELGVDGILEGSVERNGNHVHMTVQLIHAPSDSHVWAESYDREFEEAFTVPTDISLAVAKRIGDAPSAVPKPQRYVSPEAHDAYLRGRHYWFANNLPKGMDQFKKAIELQPDYALAWSGLADTYVVQAVGNMKPSADVVADAEAAAQKALSLEDSTAEVHNTLAGFYLFLKWDPKHANEESERAIAINPNLAEAHHLHAYVLLALARPEEALQEQRRFSELDHFARPWSLGKVETMLRKYDLAENELRTQLDLNPQEPLSPWLLSEVLELKGDLKGAVQYRAMGFRHGVNEKTAREFEAAYKTGGWEGASVFQLNMYKANIGKSYVSPMDLAFACAHTRNKEQTLHYLEAAYQERTPWLMLLQNEPDFDFLHGEPRYRSLIAKLGLPPQY